MRTVDTDVVAVALECFHQLQDKRIWVESGVQSKSFSINRLFDQLGEQLCKALPFYHAFTGCDYTSLFNRKRKITLFKFLKKYPELQETFLNLSNSEGISDDIKSIIESFVCQMYGRKKNNSVDQACVEIFVTKSKPKKGSASPNQIQAKKLHSSIIPPCCIKRSSDISMLQVSGRTHLGWNQHHIFLYHLFWCWMKTGHIASNGLKAMLHQRLLKWLRTILALVMVSFSILKYKDACYKITVTPISIIQPSFWYPPTRNFFFNFL